MKRRGVTNAQLLIALIIVVALGAVVLRGIYLPDDRATNTSDETIYPYTPIVKEYKVTSITQDKQIVPSGEPVEITVMLERISGDDPFPVTLSISGAPYETRNITFGESDHVSTKFIVSLTTQGIYEAHMNDIRSSFEVREMPVAVDWISVSPRFAEPNREITVTFGAANINHTPVSQEVYAQINSEGFFYPVQLDALGSMIFNFTFTRYTPGEYILKIGDEECNFTIIDTDPYNEEEEFQWTPIEWNPDPATWNMTNILPPEASSIRLHLPVPIESIIGNRWAGIGGIGLHYGGHI
ncbi:MAG: hypothetical protein NWF07_00820 [Candidatus Bathyarchaeota archaeon]|nr:hypothetical protein [Candidatus Bathyarchaeota archaeon]